MATARPGDVVLVLGKGHEATQEWSDGVIAFDDRHVLASFIHDRHDRHEGESGRGVE